jgi:hypothetical protein
MNMKLLLGTMMLALSVQAYADTHEAARLDAPAEFQASPHQDKIRSMQRPKFRQQILDSEAAARETARSSCESLLDERRETAIFGLFTIPRRQLALRFPADLGRFSKRHADNAIHCSKISLEASYGTTDRDRLSMFQTNPGAVTFMTMLFLPLGLASAGGEDLNLQAGQWAAISSVRLVCEPRPDADILILQRVRECAQVATGTEAPTYCDGIENAARNIERTEFVEEASCVEANSP